MKIEQITLESGEVCIITPPSLYDLPIFEKLFYVVCTNINDWNQIQQDKSVVISFEGAVKSQFLSFFAIAFKRVPISLDSFQTLADFNLLKEGFERVLTIDDLPSFKTDSSNKSVGFQPKIIETGDIYSDYIGDILAELETLGVQLCKDYDLNSIRQIVHRISQHRYWSIPDNREKAQREQDIEMYADKLYELSFDDLIN